MLDPELIRIITLGQPRDEDGAEAMVKLEVSPSNPRAFLLPVPAGLSRDDPRLFGMWIYEFRFGHEKPWSTAHGRFGRPLRVTGIQHPAPHLTCAAAWRPLGSKLVEHHLKHEAGIGGKMLHIPYGLVVTAPYATPVLDGRRVGDGFPRTTIGFLVYAQAHQAGGRLLRHRGAAPLRSGQHRIDYGAAHFTQEEIVLALREFGLPANAPLSALAVEFYGPGGTVGSEYREFKSKPIDMAAARVDERLDERFSGVEEHEMPDPFARNVFGRRRILRTSPLTAVQPVC